MESASFSRDLIGPLIVLELRGYVLVENAERPAGKNLTNHLLKNPQSPDIGINGTID